MKILRLNKTTEPNWWVGEVHNCTHHPRSCVFQLGESDKPKQRYSSGDKQHTPQEYIWSVNCPQCGKEIDIRAEEF